MSQTADDHAIRIVDELSQRTGVSADIVRQVIEGLGLDPALASLADLAGLDKLGAISANNLVVGIRYDKAFIFK